MSAPVLWRSPCPKTSSAEPPVVTRWGYRQAAGTDECFCPGLFLAERRASTSLKGLLCLPCAPGHSCTFLWSICMGAPQRLQASLEGYWSGNPHCSFPQHMPRGLRTRNQEGPSPTPPPPLTVEKVGQVSQALLCSFHHSQHLSSSLLPNPALSCSSNVILKLSRVPDLTAPLLSRGCLVSHRILIPQIWSHKEQRKGREGEHVVQPENCPFSPAKTASAGSPGASWCSVRHLHSLASLRWTRR